MTSKIYLDGKTYPVKDALKTLGCRWDAEKKSWYATDEKMAEEAKKIISGGSSKETTTTTSSRPRYSRCQFCGVAATRYCKIYAIGECGSCFEERKMGY